MFECHAWYECHWSAGWYVGLAANGVIAAAYLAIAFLIARGIWRTDQWENNPLARATGAIFLTCGIGHGIIAAHLLLPTFGIEELAGNAARLHWTEWHMWLWTPLTMGAAIWYWRLRKRFPSLVQGTALFEDLRERQSQALEIHDNVSQNLATARMAMDQGDEELCRQQLDEALASSKQITGQLMGEGGEVGEMGPGDFRREEPAGRRSPR